MAWIFSLAIECGDESAARECARYFLAGPAAAALQVDVEQGGDDGAWWAVVIPDGVSRSGVISKAAARSLTEAGRDLLERLRGAPRFRFALVGVEALDALTQDDLVARSLQDASSIERLHGLVVSDELRRRLDPRIGFEAFAPGYDWLPYKGERYPDAS